MCSREGWWIRLVIQRLQLSLYACASNSLWHYAGCLELISFVVYVFGVFVSQHCLRKCTTSASVQSSKGDMVTTPGEVVPLPENFKHGREPWRSWPCCRRGVSFWRVQDGDLYKEGFRGDCPPAVRVRFVLCRVNSPRVWQGWGADVMNSTSPAQAAAHAWEDVAAPAIPALMPIS